MAIKLAERYLTRANDPSLDYPTGSFKNKSAPGAVDGTPLEKDWANDFLGFRDALLDEAGIVANGVIDTAQASQVLIALISMINSRLPPSQLQTDWNTGLITTESSISPEKLDAKIKTLTLGDGQSWQNLTSSRASGVTYTNTSGRTKSLLTFIRDNGTGVIPIIYSIDSLTVTRVNQLSNSDTDIFFIPVPDGSTYSINFGANVLDAWWELG